MRGGDACVALAGGEKRAQEQDEGDASVPTHHILHLRPYGHEAASQAYRYISGWLMI